MDQDQVGSAADEVKVSRRRVVLLSASAIAAAAVASEGETAHAGPVTDPWRLGGNANIATDGSNYLGTNNIAPLIFKTTKGAGGPIERMRIGTSGNVGIGTTSPQALLHTKANSVAPAVLGENLSVATGTGVQGTHAGGGSGVRGVAQFGTGVRGEGGIGVFADGTQMGVYGQNATTEEGAVGVYGVLTSATPGEDSAAVLGRNNATNGLGYGVKGWHASAGTGVRGEGRVGVSGSGGTHGVTGVGTVMGVQGIGGSYGVYGRGTGTAPIGVWAGALGPGEANGVVASAVSTTGDPAYAGNFSGGVRVTGTLTKGGGSFKIDHPLDPENKYLSHSFVESPDMMNVYNGNVTLDDNGAAEVTMPVWFEALNRDFRYQLTTIGAPALVYVAEEITGNRFSIAGGTAGLKVSWQVTGIRQDVYANANRIPIEEDKPVEERGPILHPCEHGKPESAGVDFERIAKLRADHPEHPQHPQHAEHPEPLPAP